MKDKQTEQNRPVYRKQIMPGTGRYEWVVAVLPVGGNSRQAQGHIRNIEQMNFEVKS